jgi:hypothetical protein
MSLNPLKYEPTKLNTAQRLLIALGLDDLRLVAHKRGLNESATKKGPGRKAKHASGGKRTKPAHRTFADDLMRVWAEKRAAESAQLAMKKQLRRLEA